MSLINAGLAQASLTRPWPAARIEYWPIERLIPYANNPRLHRQADFTGLLPPSANGLGEPVLVDENGRLIAGHAGTPRCCALSAAQPVPPKCLDIFRAKHHTVLTNLMVTRMASTAGPFTFAELQTITSLGRGEIRECINRRIISAPAGVGQGNHRSYNKWNLVEGVIAAALLRQVRAGAVEQIMNNLRSMLDFRRIDPDKYCESPSTFDYDVIFPPRSEPDDKSGLPLGEEMAESGYLLGTATQEKHYGPPLTEGTPLAAFCKLPIDLKQAVRFVNHMIETRL